MVNREKKYTETVLLNNVSLDNTTYIDVIKRVIPQNNSPEINKILINDGSSSIVLEELLPAGYNSTNIKDSFVFNSDRSRYLIFITSWDSDNKALDISGIFYEILIFNEKLERLPAIEDLFFNFESKTEKEELNLIRGNKDLVIQKLQELESEGKL